MDLLMEELNKITLIEDLREEGYDDHLIDSVIDSLNVNHEVAYVCNTSEELSRAIQDMCED